MTAKSAQSIRYRANVDIDWPDGERIVSLPAGKESSAIPPAIAAWMVACGAIEIVSECEQ